MHRCQWGNGSQQWSDWLLGLFAVPLSSGLRAWIEREAIRWSSSYEIHTMNWLKVNPGGSRTFRYIFERRISRRKSLLQFVASSRRVSRRSAVYLAIRLLIFNKQSQLAVMKIFIAIFGCVRLDPKELQNRKIGRSLISNCCCSVMYKRMWASR